MKHGENTRPKRKIFRVKKNDEVKVIAGKDRGKTGRVIEVDHENERVIVEGINLRKKAVKKRRQNEKGGIIEVEGPIRISNVMVLCKKCGPVRVGYRFENDEKVRFCKKCGEVL
ncbi:MAG TPA: 50S ribosomal protein L24 [Spirochaetales bacterium]|nr:50S ribosomal protein L24 [Spirochaetales bacterium]HOV38324.1 50S ribosomal protein L24 [Spirochaetales bacterium]